MESSSHGINQYPRAKGKKGMPSINNKSNAGPKDRGNRPEIGPKEMRTDKNLIYPFLEHEKYKSRCSC
jgi:hypothetical protein